MRAILAGVAVCLMAPLPLVAHHSFAAVFDDDSPVNIEGRVTKVEWTNPHIWVYLEVTNNRGTAENWQCEGGTPNSLRRLGWSRDTLQQGDQVQIEGFRARDGTETCNVRVVTKDGKRLFAGSSFDQQ